MDLLPDLQVNARRWQVGWLLHSSTQKYELPWQRIIKSDGSLSFPKNSLNFTRQKELLEVEGIAIKNGRVDLKRFLWKNDLPDWLILNSE